MKGMHKVSRGHGFRGALNYAFERDSKDVAPGRLLGGNMDGHSPSELSSEFAISRQVRPDIRKPVWHNALRFPKGEKISDEQWVTIANDYMIRMGFTDLHQRVYVQHDDETGQHVHIIASRIALDGHLYLGRNENLISTRIIQQLEHDHNLTITKGVELQGDGTQVHPLKKRLKKAEQEMGKRSGTIPPRETIQNAIDQIFSENLPSPSDAGKITATQFAQALTSAGIKYKAHIASTGRLNGFSFEVDGVALSGSQLGKGYALQGLVKRGLDYSPERDAKNLVIHAAKPNEADEKPKVHYIAYRSFLEEQRPHIETERSRVAIQRREMTLKHNEERTDLTEAHRAERNKLSETYRHDPHTLNIQKMLLAKQQADEKAALQEKLKSERQSLTSPKVPDYYTWLSTQDETLEQKQAIELEMKRKAKRRAITKDEAIKAEAQLSGSLSHSPPLNPAQADIRNFKGTVNLARGIIEYWSSNGNLAFSDIGNRINVSQERDPETVLAALQLATQKFGKLTLAGGPEFQQLCISLAAEHGFKFIDEKLNHAVEIERNCQMIAAAKPVDLVRGTYRGKIHSVTPEAIYIEVKRGYLYKLPKHESLEHIQTGDRVQVKYHWGRKPEVKHSVQQVAAQKRKH